VEYQGGVSPFSWLFFRSSEIASYSSFFTM
jgi:hypothetical protein